MKMTTGIIKTTLISIAILLPGLGLAAQEATPAPTSPAFSAAPAVTPAAAAPSATPHVNAYEEFKSALGFHVSEYAGYGFSWLYQENGNGIQINGGAMFSPQYDYSATGYSEATGYTTGEYSVGLEYQRMLFGGDLTDWLSGQFFFSAGLGHTGKLLSNVLQEAQYDASYNLLSPAVYGEPVYGPQINAGLGLGMEIILFKHLSIPAELGMAAFWDLNSGALSVRLSPQVGFRYRY